MECPFYSPNSTPAQGVVVSFMLLGSAVGSLVRFRLSSVRLAPSWWWEAGFWGILLPAVVSPAHPGEVIVAYMTGLGPVDDNGEVKSGFSCSFDSAQGDILYAGLAPGLTGSYQVNIRVPNLHSSLASLFCGWDPVTRARATV